MEKERLRQLQLTELSILQDFDIFCKENKINYFLNGGTLLGAVRHKGFIPWDDDIDVQMPYYDYLKFRKLVKNLPDKYFFQDYQTDPNWYRPHAKIRLKNTAMIENNFISYDINHGIWIDIFIIIGIKNETDFKIKKHLITASNYLQINNYMHNTVYDEFKKKLGRKIILIELLNKVPMKIRISIHSLMLKIICRDFKNTKYASVLWSNITKLYPSEIFVDNPVYLTFEGYSFPCSSEWDKELTITYGEYMKLPPINERHYHYTPIIDFENSYQKYMTL